MAWFDPPTATAIAAAIGVGGLLKKWGLEDYFAWRKKRELRRIAFARFYADATIRVADLKSLFTATPKDQILSEAKSLVERHSKDRSKLKFYVVQTIDTKAFELVSDQLHYLSSQDAILIRTYILRDRQLAAQYEKLGTKQFADLDPTRQISAFDEWLTSSTSLIEIGERLLSRLAQLDQFELATRKVLSNRPDNGSKHLNLLF